MTKLGDSERTAACLFYMFAVLAFDGRRTGEEGAGPSWYEWTTGRSADAEEDGRHMESALWWALRFEDGKRASADAYEWLAYVNHVLGYRRRST